MTNREPSKLLRGLGILWRFWFRSHSALGQWIAFEIPSDQCTVGVAGSEVEGQGNVIECRSHRWIFGYALRKFLSATAFIVGVEVVGYVTFFVATPAPPSPQRLAVIAFVNTLFVGAFTYWTIPMGIDALICRSVRRVYKFESRVAHCRLIAFDCLVLESHSWQLPCDSPVPESASDEQFARRYWLSLDDPSMSNCIATLFGEMTSENATRICILGRGGFEFPVSIASSDALIQLAPIVDAAIVWDSVDADEIEDFEDFDSEVLTRWCRSLHEAVSRGSIRLEHLTRCSV